MECEHSQVLTEIIKVWSYFNKSAARKRSFNYMSLTAAIYNNPSF